MPVRLSVVDLDGVGQKTTFSFDGHPGAIIRLRKQFSAYYFNVVDIHTSTDETKLAVVISVRPHESYTYPDLLGYRAAFVDLTAGDVQVCGYVDALYLSGSYSGNGLVFGTLVKRDPKAPGMFQAYRKSEVGFWEFACERTSNMRALFRAIEHDNAHWSVRLQLSFDGTKVLLIEPTHDAAVGRIVIFNRVGFDYLLLQTLEPQSSSKTDTWLNQFGHSHEYKIKDNGQRELLLVKNEEGKLFKYELTPSGFFKPL